ncbi:response regulator [Spirosoma lituiforme]
MPAPFLPVIWIVDDDEDDQYLFEIAFKTLDPPVSVRRLNDGEELLPALSQSDVKPSLILLDLNMPYLNGFEVLQQLRANPDYSNLPVVVLTTSNHHEDEVKAMNLGASAFLTKPGSSGKLLMLFGQLVQQWKIS